MKPLPLFVMLSLGLAACTGTAPRFNAAPVDMAERVSVRYARIEVANVSLPAYAQSEDIYVEDARGAIVPMDALWADEPGRAITLQIARDLDAVTGRLVAADPWPFRDLPDVRLDVRLVAFHATGAETFRLAGTVYVAPEGGGSDRAKRFEIERPIIDQGAAAIARARAEAVTALSLFIARDGLR